jgi:hypothetical protein
MPLRRAKDLLQSRYTESLSLDEIADAARIAKFSSLPGVS